MKKVLLATTALVATAGFAAAEVSFSGKAGVAAASADRADSEMYTGIDFNVNLSGEADSGLTWATSFDMGNGSLIDMDDDFAVDAQSAHDGADVATVTLGYQGYTVAFAQEDIDDLYDDGNHHDVSLSGSVSGVDFAITSDLDNDESETSYSVGGTFSGVTATVKGTTSFNSNSAMKLDVSYQIGSLTVSAGLNDTGVDGVDNEMKVGASYTMEGVTLAYTAISPDTANGDFGDEWDASISYSANGLAATIKTDETEVMKAFGTYDLGGGTSAFVSYKDVHDTDTGDFSAIGLTMAF